MRKNRLLNKNWELAFRGETYKTEAPCSLLGTLLEEGIIEDPFYRDNEDRLRDLHGSDFTLSTRFDICKEEFSSDNIDLVFEGLDTLVTLFLNGEKLGFADNMHREWRFPVKGRLKPAGNELNLLFHSPTEYIRKAQEETFADGMTDAMAGFSHIRKAHYMFGWDWGPRLPDAGIWRNVKLDFYRGRIDFVPVTQKHGADRVELEIAPEVFGAEGSLRYSLYSPDGGLVAETDKGSITVRDPLLWWPRGYGEPHLYSLKVKLISPRGEVLDYRIQELGLRTVELSREKDEWGESFAHVVNGLPVFAMGADYVPEDNILSRISRHSARTLLEYCCESNFNTVRIWGGGYYPDDYFYELCDRLGLLVWQDFMVACAVIDLSRTMEENLTEEVRYNVRRLAHHPSLVLLCGNNEMEWQVKEGPWKATEKQAGDHIKLYEYIIPRVLESVHPGLGVPYWPSSPSSGGSFDDPNGPDRGDVHYWDVWHENKPFTEYRKYFFRYASEFGFQSFPDLKTIEGFTEEGDRNIFSYVMEKHQRNAVANGKILNYISQNYLYPRSLESLIYTSQILQADAIRYGVEHWRRNRGRCMGAIYWQLNDCWPVTSWSSMDYHFRWKALQYRAKKFFAPLMISCEERGFVDQKCSVNEEDGSFAKEARISLANETRERAEGEVIWELRDRGGNVLGEGSRSVSVAPFSSEYVFELDFGDIDVFTSFLAYRYERNGSVLSEGTSLFVPPKFFRFRDPKIRCDAEGSRLTLVAESFAKSVEIFSPDSDLLLSDNFFDMIPNMPYHVEILKGGGADLGQRSVFDI